jgi:hypothetical protein
MLYASPVLLIFACLGNFYRGIGAAICVGLVMLVIMTRWDLRKHAWFWTIIVFAAFLQVPLVLFIPWKNRDLTGISLLPVAVLDYGIVYGCIKLAEKTMTRSDGAASRNPV